MADRGRKPLGSEIGLGVQCVDGSGVPAAPTNAPTMSIYTQGGVLVVEKTIPPQDKANATGWFSYTQPLNSLFSAGRHYVRYEWVVSATTYTKEHDEFEVIAGGNDDGAFLSMYFLDRPEGSDWVFGQTSQGEVTANRGPRV